MSPATRLGELDRRDDRRRGLPQRIFRAARRDVISISVGRAVLASTGKDWEGVGIAPTIETAADKALEVAQVHALRQLAQTATASATKPARGHAQRCLRHRSKPVATALPLSAYAGTYRRAQVTVEDGKLCCTSAPAGQG